MASQEKQKKGFSLFFYKSSTKNQKPKSQPAVVTTNNKIKPAVTQSPSSLQKKLENYQEIGPDNVTTNEPAAVNLQSPHSLLLKKLESSQHMEHSGRRGNFVEARKSVSHVETNLASVASFLQVKVLLSDMPGSMQIHAFRCARRTYDSLEKFSSKHIAYNIKKEFDKVYGPAWHCIVGSDFGSYVTHSTGCFLYFSMENLYVLVFKTKVQIQKALE